MTSVSYDKALEDLNLPESKEKILSILKEHYTHSDTSYKTVLGTMRAEDLKLTTVSLQGLNRSTYLVRTPNSHLNFVLSLNLSGEAKPHGLERGDASNGQPPFVGPAFKLHCLGGMKEVAVA